MPFFRRTLSGSPKTTTSLENKYKEAKEEEEEEALLSSHSRSKKVAARRVEGGFPFLRSLLVSSDSNTSKVSHSTLAVSAFAATVLSFAASASFIVARNVKTKQERDLPKGTHWRAAKTGAKALTLAMISTTVLAVTLSGTAWLSFNEDNEKRKKERDV